ncbi:MAG: phosphate acyltransferase [Candidatus Omnitrophica bacterium]|nr:phosphate acyltransferase [Candidatus Omnitrophota bacterium]
MEIIKELRQKSANLKRRIVLPEAYDQRVRQASEIIAKEEIAEVILLEKEKIKPQDKKRYVETLFQMRRDRGMTLEEAERVLDNPLYYAGMMVSLGEADGFVAGACTTTPEVIRAAIRCLGVEERIGFVFSCFIMILEDKNFGENGVYVFADCGVIPDPDFQQLAQIAIHTADFSKDVLGFLPRVALLSYSTKGSSKVGPVEKVKKAVELANKIRPDLLIDGELQVDAAIVSEVAKIKFLDSPVGGKANILIFPNLESGNIGYKLVQRLAKARAIGPLLLGLKKACSDLSRGCSVDDIIDCVAVSSILSVKK